MILRLMALILLPIIAYYLVRSTSKRFSLSARQTQILFCIVATLLVVGVLIVMGRLPIHFIFAPLAAAGAFLSRFLPTLLRLLPFWQLLRSRAASAGPGKSGQNSTIRTRYLAMELDHDTGNIDGVVLLGIFKGAQLSELSIDDLKSLREACAVDADSRQLLDAYLDRNHGEQGGWRDGTQTGNENGIPVDESQMTRELALEILGLQGEPSGQAISKAHRALMQRMHPDRGGSDYLAQKINQAKDFLLQK